MSYFVVFYKGGFAPKDLVRGKFALHQFLPRLALTVTVCIAQKAGGFFVKGAKDFINYKGESLNDVAQIKAYGQAQSIGSSPASHSYND